MPDDIAKRIRNEVFKRSQHISRNSVNAEERTLQFTFSSELPVDRWFGKEILDHSQESIRTDRLSDGAPLLLDHDGREVIGVIEDFSIDAGAKKASVTARFSRSARGEEVWNDVMDGIRKNVSVGYVVHDEDPEVEEDDSGIKAYRFRDWEPLEVSFVGVPADHTVGVGRSKDNDKSRRQDEMKKCKFCGKEHETLDERGFCPECVTRSATASTPAAPAPAAPAQRAEPEPTPEINVDEVRAEAKKEETERVSEVLAIGEQFGMQDQAREAVEKNVPIDEFRKATMELLSKASKPGMITSDKLGMNQKETEEYSFCRAILSMAGDKEHVSCFEREIHDTILTERGSQHGGFLVPSDQIIPRANKREMMAMIARTTMIAGTDSLGGYLVETANLAERFLDFLRAKTVMMEMGAQAMEGLVGDITWPTQASDPTLFWLATETSSLMESNLTFGQNAMSPKPVTIKQSYSRQLLRQSNPSIESIVRNGFVNKFAVEVDRIGINGKTANDEPVGILNTSGIGAVALGSDGGAITWGSVVDLETEVAVDNADMGALGYITNPKVRGAAKQIVKPGTAAGFVWSDVSTEAPLNGFRAGVTTNVPSNLTKGTGTGLSAAIYGNFTDAIYAFWGAMEIEEDRITNADSGGGIVVRLFHFMDFITDRAQSFSAIKDIDTT